jgi:hypothetical protein
MQTLPPMHAQPAILRAPLAQEELLQLVLHAHCLRICNHRLTNVWLLATRTSSNKTHQQLV